LQREPIYEGLAIQDGIHLPSAEGRSRHGRRQVVKVMRGAGESLPAEMTVNEALGRVRSSALRTWLVTDKRGVIGVINLSKLEQAAAENAENADKQVGDLVDPIIFPHVHPDQALDLALERMGANQLEILPVVNRGDVHKLEGVVTLRDVLDAYGVGRA
jgi:CIC family chloride channel protein